MKPEKIKPIPKYIQKQIYHLDLKRFPEQKGQRRFYAYLTKNEGELVKITVAVRNRYSKWHCKQVAIHGLDSDVCYVKDMVLTDNHSVYVTNVPDDKIEDTLYMVEMLYGKYGSISGDYNNLKKIFNEDFYKVY